MPLKLMTLVGTRPEIIKLSMVIKEADKHFNHILVHTGQNYDYELNQIFFEELEIRKPNYFLQAARENPAKTIAEVISKSDEVFEKEKPDAILIYGDTNSCLCVISAKRRKIPIFHMEAGNRCFDQRVPEEINRKIVDHLSDVNFVHSEHARRYLISEGLRPELIFKSGSPMPEVLSFYKPKIDKSNILERLGLFKKEFFIVSIHREENVDNERNFEKILFVLNKIEKQYGKRVLVSTHPRTWKRLEEKKLFQSNSRIEFIRPLGFMDYIKLQQNAFCVLSDSGTITEESSILNFPALMVRQTHERPEGMDAGVLIMSGVDEINVIDSIEITLKQFDCFNGPNRIEDYSEVRTSSQIIKILQSYTDYIKRVIWNEFR